jgi:hypothetical protein
LGPKKTQTLTLHKKDGKGLKALWALKETAHQDSTPTLFKKVRESNDNWYLTIRRTPT